MGSIIDQIADYICDEHQFNNEVRRDEVRCLKCGMPWLTGWLLLAERTVEQRRSQP